MVSRRSLLAAGPLLVQLGAPARPPNIVFVLVDDLRWDELGCTGHPFAQTPHIDRLAREGALFRNAFATTPLCSPSRATFLTGLYPRANGIADNTDRSAASHRLITWPRLLQEKAGYETAFIGKWHMGNDDTARPGFDRWVSFAGQGESTDPVLNENGKSARVKGYITDILSQRAADVIRKPRGSSSKPFCLYLAHKAVHPNIQQAADGSIVSAGSAEEFIVASRHRALYAGARIPRRGNYGVPPRHKPALQQEIEGVPPLGPATGTDDATILNRMRMTKAIDEGVGALREALQQTGQLDNTLFVVTSDHGYFYGEHCLGPERRLAYEETIRIPLIVRHPRLVKAGSSPAAMVASIDIAPTMLELAGVTKAPRFHGRSLAPLMAGRGRAPWRDALLFEYNSDRVFPRIRKMGYQAVRTERWKYIHYRELTGADELYDLQADPFELDNLVGSSPELPRLQARLAELVRQTEAPPAV